MCESGRGTKCHGATERTKCHVGCTYGNKAWIALREIHRGVSGKTFEDPLTGAAPRTGQPMGESSGHSAWRCQSPRGHVRVPAPQGRCRDRALPPVRRPAQSTLDAIEMVFSQVERRAVSELVGLPEGRGDLDCGRRVGGRPLRGALKLLQTQAAVDPVSEPPSDA